MNFIKVLFTNLMGFDSLIVIVSLVNIIFVSNRIKKQSKMTENTLRKVIYKPIEEIVSKLSGNQNEEENIDIHLLKENREKEDAWYQIFVSITSILPLMGILGTVISLLNIDLFEQGVIAINFTKALTSTFWGIVGAISCKILESTIAPLIDRNHDNFEMLISQLRQGYNESE